MKVGLFIPCYIDQFYPKVAVATMELLDKLGCEIVFPLNQTCCGQPAFNAGFLDEARAVCNKFIQDFDNADYIVAPSASCVGFVRNYYTKLFDNSSVLHQVKNVASRTFEFAEFLTDVLKVEKLGAVFNAKATYHDSCAALRECKIKDAPRRLLSNVSGLEMVEMNEVETCCCFGGTFAVKFDSISIGMADQKVTNALATQAEYIISTDLSCLMHLDGYIKGKNLPLKTIHIADVLANGWE